MTTSRLIGVAIFLCSLTATRPVFAQTGATQGVTAGTPDDYLQTTIDFADLHDFRHALETFTEGVKRFPSDHRFHPAGFGLFRKDSKTVKAREHLRDVLIANAENDDAMALLVSMNVSIEMTDFALRTLDHRGEPRLAAIQSNYSEDFSSPIISHSLAFHDGGMLNHRAWKTTTTRLEATSAFSNIGLDLEPSGEPGQYDAVVRTTRKPITPTGLAVGILKGLPVATLYMDLWNLGGTYAQVNMSYRWKYARQRATIGLTLPSARLSLFIYQLDTIWRSEQWVTPSHVLTRYRTDIARFSAKHISNHRIEYGAGIEYQNRKPVPSLGKLLLHAQYRPLNGRVKSQYRVDAFGARSSIAGDLSYSGATASIANRLVLSKDHGAFIDVTAQGGTMRGRAPFEDYFMLGVDTDNAYPLRGHDATLGDVYGNSPLGTDFALFNTSIEHRIATAPFIHSPIQAMVFSDNAKVFDRNRQYKQLGWFFDAGAGLKVELEETELVLLYGRNLADGTGLFSASIQHRFW